MSNSDTNHPDSRSQVQQVTAQFNKQAQAYADTEQARDERAMTYLTKLCGANSQARALDVACGPGVLTCALAQQCASVVGFDATTGLLDIARRNAAEKKLLNIEFEQGDVNDLPYTNAFDIVTCRAAFHHFADPRHVLHKLTDALRPGGCLLIADIVCSSDPAKAAQHNHIERLCDPSHTNALSEHQFKALFADAGLTLEQHKAGEMHYELEGWIKHGGPGDDAAAAIRTAMQASHTEDNTGLQVRRQEQDWYFTHQTGIFCLRVPGADA